MNGLIALGEQLHHQLMSTRRRRAATIRDLFKKGIDRIFTRKKEQITTDGDKPESDNLAVKSAKGKKLK